jgi:hypothetical protein
MISSIPYLIYWVIWNPFAILNLVLMVFNWQVKQKGYERANYVRCSLWFHHDHRCCNSSCPAGPVTVTYKWVIHRPDYVTVTYKWVIHRPDYVTVRYKGVIHRSDYVTVKYKWVIHRPDYVTVRYKGVIHRSDYVTVIYCTRGSFTAQTM